LNPYQFIIPNKKRPVYQVFSYGLILLSCFGLYLFDDQATYPFGRNFYLILAAIVLLRSGWDYLTYKKKKTFLPQTTFLIVFVLIWFRADFSTIAWLWIFLSALYFISVRKLKIEVNEQGLEYPSFPPKKMGWSEINNLLLKDDILTIDLKNKKIYQYLIEYPGNEVNQQEFNDFCQKKLMAVGS